MSKLKDKPNTWFNNVPLYCGIVAKLLTPIEMSGGFTGEVMEDLAVELGLTYTEVNTLFRRARVDWKRMEKSKKRYAHLAAEQVAELRDKAVRVIMDDLIGADEDQSLHWAEAFLEGKESAKFYLDVMDWANLDAEERTRYSLAFDPETGKPVEEK